MRVAAAGVDWRGNSVGVRVLDRVRVTIGSLAVLGLKVWCGYLYVSAESDVFSSSIKR